MSVIETGLCRIEKIDNNGLGVGNSPKGPVLLPFTLPGEMVSFERHKYRSSSNCVLISIISPSKDRVAAQCKYFGVCGGCRLQHLRSELYNDYKQKLLRDVLRSAKINIISEPMPKPMIIIDAGNRRRITLHAIKKQDQIYMGFYRFHSHQIVNIDSCPLVTTELSNLLLPLKDLLQHILEDKQKAEISLMHADNGIDLMVQVQGEITSKTKEREQLKEISLSILAKYGVIRFTLRAIGEDCIFELAMPHVIFDGAKIEVEADAFLQSSALSDKILSKLVLDFCSAPLEPREEIAPEIRPPAQLVLESTTKPKVIDLFCGRGTITLPLSRHYDVTGVEIDERALTALRKGAVAANREIKLILQDLWDKPVLANDLQAYDIAVINPPRIGARPQCDELAKSGLKKIIYISCNLKSFVKDAKILINHGYQLVSVAPVDQFYWSHHLELVACFTINLSYKY